MARKLVVFALLLFHFHFYLHSSVGENSMESVPELQKSMYMDVDGYPCVRLLNLSGEIGCANPGRDKVVAPITRFSANEDLDQPSTVLVSLDEFQTFFTRLSNDSSFARNVGGVIVESTSTTEVQNKLKGFSPAQKFPQAEFAPYNSVNYEWNPIGSGIMWNAYNFPVFLLPEDSAMTLREVIVKNEKTKNAHTATVAEFDLVMQTTKSGTRDSESCLKEETCLPLGGYRFGGENPQSYYLGLKEAMSGHVCLEGSVWSSLPPMNISASDQAKPVILTLASMDSASFFRDKSFGADSPVSGMIALLAAVDALSHVDGLDELSKQLVFLIFTGEAWGYLGSRRFLLELDLQSDGVNGLYSTSIETVMEIGSVGKGISEGAKTFYAHTAGVSSATKEILNALKRAQESLASDNVTLSSANGSNPGIPPSSLMSFLKKNSSTSGVVLEDFDTAFTNNFYNSHLDDSSNINSSALVAAGSLVARSLYILASDNKTISSAALSAINVNASLVKELIGCLLNCEPGLSCELVKSYISPTQTCPSHYVGVILGEPTSIPNPGYVEDVPRFLWNFLADRTSTPRKNGSFVCTGNCSNNEVCIKAETDGKGICVTSTTRYVPAYSTRLKFDSASWTWTLLGSNSSDPMGMVDPVWTESNWNTIGLRVYSVQNATYDRLVLLGGIAITGLSYLAIIFTRAFIRKALKQD